MRGTSGALGDVFGLWLLGAIWALMLLNVFPVASVVSLGCWLAAMVMGMRRIRSASMLERFGLALVLTLVTWTMGALLRAVPDLVAVAN